MSNIKNHHMYKTYEGMMERCHNKKRKDYHRYGGRGIYVQKSWHANARGFIEYIETALGDKPSPSHSLDRIDNNRGYEEGNLRWSSKRGQQNNKSNNRILIVDGVALTSAQWSRRVGINQKTLHDRLRQGWSDEDAVLKPVRKW